MKKYLVPLRLVELDDHSFHLLAEGSINEIPLNLVIDTGASRTVFDLKLIGSELRVTEQTIPEIQSAGIMAENIEGKMGVAGKFSIGPLVLHNYPVIMMDLKAIKRLYENVTGWTIHGLLGSDFLFDHKAEIDYGKLLLTLRK